jgi:hypothetical protein
VRIFSAAAILDYTKQQHEEHQDDQRKR